MSDSAQNGIFIRTNHDLKRDIQSDMRTSSSNQVHTVRVCNQTMLVAVQNKTIVCRSLSSSNKPTEIVVPISNSDSIQYLHMSPTGFHAFVSSLAGDNFYINIKNNSVAPIKKLKDQISAVGWNPEYLKETETGPILLGSTHGAIYETNLSSSGNLTYFKEHCNRFGRERVSEQKICELRFFVINDDDPKAAKWVLFVLQPGRLHSIYALVGAPPAMRSNYLSSASLQTFVPLPDVPQHIFHPFFAPKDSQQTTLCMPASDNAPTNLTDMLAFYPGREDVSQPFRFLWLGSSGYTVGKVNLMADKARDIVEEEKHTEHRRVEGLIQCPIGISLTEFHMILAYQTRLVAISLFNHAVVYEDIWPSEYGNCIGLTFDNLAEYHWLFTPTTTLRYRPNDEGRYVWRYFLDNRDYAQALSVARDRLSVDPDAYQLVLKKQAEKFIAEQNYSAAAEILCQSTEPFETVVLKLLSADDDRHLGLKTLLEKKLERLTGADDRMKRDALVIWLLEVQLSELAKFRREPSNSDVVAELELQLQRFLTKKVVYESVSVNQEAVYRLMVSHADFSSQLYLAKQLKDYPTAINIHILQEQYKEVLDILVQLNSPEAFYEYSPRLVEHIPFELFHHLIDNESIKPSRMITTLCKCQKVVKVAKQCIRYIEWAITLPNYSHDLTLNNLLILLYAQYSTTKLHEYFVDNGRDKTCLPYDLEFAIRTCEQYGHDKSLIYLYCVSELFNEAVDKALEIKLDLAKDCARLMDADVDDIVLGLEPKYSKEDRKRIWLKIAKNVIEKEKDAAKCIDLLKESNNAISIQDIFPYFPDFTKIEHFKDALCDCLKDHSKSILEIQQSLKEATQVAQEIRERTDRLKNRVTIVKAGDVCAVCKHSLAGRPFYPFNCRHFFHRECLEESANVFLSLEDRQKLADLIIREKRVLGQIEIEERSPGKGSALAEREARFRQIVGEIDDILGTDCPLCGMMAIDLIDTPLFTDVDYADDLDSWRI